MRGMAAGILLCASFCASLSHAQDFGKYVGTVQTEWLEPDRKMRLLARFSYIDPNGLEWEAPKGWIIDGASIPRFAWSVIGGPYDGRYRNASVIHDVACEQKAKPWEEVHETFYYAMLASGVERWRAKTMYAAVYHFGPRWPQIVTVPDVPRDQAETAREEALARAEPGSGATIMEVRPRQRTRGRADGDDGDTADVEIKVEPPAQTLSEDDFEQLKDKIRQAEAPAAPASEDRRPTLRGGGGAGGGGGYAYRQARPRSGSGLSLEDIRGYQP